MVKNNNPTALGPQAYLDMTSLSSIPLQVSDRSTPFDMDTQTKLHLKVQPIANGYLIISANQRGAIAETFFCADVDAVGERVKALMIVGLVKGEIK